MVPSSQTSASKHDAIVAIWDRLAEFNVSECDEALHFIFESLCAIIGADNAMWLAGARLRTGTNAKKDPGNGWRVPAMKHFKPTPAKDMRSKAFQKSLDSASDAAIGMPTKIITSETGQFRTYRLHGNWLDLEAFKKTAHYEQFYAQPKIDDRLWVLIPLGADFESCFIFDKVDTTARFSTVDADLAGLALRGIKLFHRTLALSHGLIVARSPLTAAERKVLHMLLSGGSEKEIASALGSGIGTTHNHVGQIFKKFGVRSRAELTAIWLGHRK